MADENKSPENEIPENKSSENESSVHDEMEELARIFREELSKSKEEAEKAENETDSDTANGIDALNGGYEVEGYAVTMGEKTNAEPEEMCECCGERPRGTERDPNSPFCKECAAIMEKYPYDFKGILMLIAVLGTLFVSLITFVQLAPIFSNVYRGKAAYNDKKLYSALSYYSEAESYAIENEISLDFKNLRRNEILLFYEIGDDQWVSNSFQNPAFLCALTLIENTYDVEKIGDKKISEIFNNITKARANIFMLGTYESDAETEEDYNRLMAKYESLIGKKIYISDVKNFDSSTVHDDLSDGYKPSDGDIAVDYDEGWVRLFQFDLAERKNKTDDMALYIKKAADASTDYEVYSDILFAQFSFDAENYEQAKTLIERIGERNSESVIYHYLLAKLNRLENKNYSAAKEICLTGLETAAASYKSYDLIAYAGSVLSMEKALNLIMLKDYSGAYASAEEAVSYQNDFYGSTSPYARDLFAILALATNNKEKYDDLASAVAANVEENGEEYDFSSYVYDYKNNKISLEEIVQSGYFDVL